MHKYHNYRYYNDGGNPAFKFSFGRSMAAAHHTPSPEPAASGILLHKAFVREREMQARTNLAAARTNMTGRYNRHHRIDTFSIGQYVTIRIPMVDRAATDNRRGADSCAGW